jgi:two-component system OmpR family response regulator
MARPKVLLVDDNQELLRLLARLIDAEGWEPITHARGKSALDAIPRQKPAVAVVDVLLPDMMGYEIAAALKKGGVPFIFMTGIFKGGRAASEARIHHGAAAYFEKPFEARRLLETIRGLLPAMPAAPEPPPARDDPSEDFDVETSVEAEEPVDGMEITGKVTVNEAGHVSAVIEGEPLQAAPVAAHPSPIASAGPAPVRTEPPDEGALRDNLPELITAFWLAQQSGELALQRGKVKKALFFEKGRPCFAISNLVADRFAPFLVRVGRIGEAEKDRAEEQAQASGRRPADVLLEMGLLREAEKIYYLAQHVKAIAYSVFAWEDGNYRIHLADRASHEPTTIDLHPARLIARGVKKLYRPERLAKLLPADDRLIPTQQPAYGLHEVELEVWEAKLLPRVDGTRTVAELVALAGKPEATVRASLWSLVALEILERRAD